MYYCTSQIKYIIIKYTVIIAMLEYFHFSHNNDNIQCEALREIMYYSLGGSIFGYCKVSQEIISTNDHYFRNPYKDVSNCIKTIIKEAQKKVEIHPLRYTKCELLWFGYHPSSKTQWSLFFQCLVGPMKIFIFERIMKE